MALNQKTLLPFETSGNEKSNDLVVFLHGYPDTTELWREIENKVNQDAFIVNISYPNYSEKESSIFGHSQPEVAKRVALIIAGFQSVKERQVTMVAHDWGAFIAYIFDKQNPGLLKQLITLDIAAWNEKSVKNLKAILAYQLPLIFAFIIGFFLPFVGNYLTKRITQGYFKYRPPHEARITWRWNYFYLYFFINFLLSMVRPKSSWIANYTPKTPIVYIYGEKKPFQFHSLKWIQFLQSIKGSEVHPVDCDHWIPIHKPDFVAQVIKRRLQTTS